MSQALREAEERLAGAGVETPRVDAELLVAHVAGLSRARLHLEPSRELDAIALEPLLRRREAREPLAYVLGEWGFRRLTLRTDRRALVPRPETEVVVDRCLELIADIAEPEVLDVGVGSGAIALALADEHPGARVTGIDASAEALALARDNAERLGLSVRLLEADVRDGLPAAPYDLVVANPPYVDAAELAALAPEVRDWEPRAALVGPGTTEAVVDTAARVLRPGGWLVLEVHEQRASEVARLVDSAGFVASRISRDLGGRDRVVEGRWSSRR
ncbi:MAG TPA: peptide chain release factor N(5)-glutamine methyltransferase [Gaiellaceae bacterium]